MEVKNKIYVERISLPVGCAKERFTGILRNGKSIKTPEWRVAKRLYTMYWNAIREINVRLNKMRTVVGYEVMNGKRVVIYKYN